MREVAVWAPQAAQETADALTAGEAAVIAAFIAGLVAVIGMIANAVIQARALRHAAARDVASAMLDFRLQQLNELYGPLLLLLAQSERLAAKLREGEPDPAAWRLLDHIDQVLGDPNRLVIAEQILEIGDKIEDILLTKAGLALHPGPPDTFELYLGHIAILRLLIRRGAHSPIAAHEYYPREFNHDVRAGYESLQERIAELETAHKEVIDSARGRRRGLP